MLTMWQSLHCFTFIYLFNYLNKAYTMINYNQFIGEEIKAQKL